MGHHSFIHIRRLSSWKTSLLVLLCILTSNQAFAQKTISGKVIDTSKDALEGANVIALGDNNRTICYAITNGNGVFHLEVPDSIKPKEVKVRYIGYDTKTVPFSEMKDGMVIAMKAGKFQLKEVKVKASKIRSMGDTLSYSVAAFRQGQDRSIADVIKKMPGLEVLESGNVTYQGMPINKFYIEGLDLMGSQYGLANKNISAENIKSVQVLQNHQPVKSLRGVAFSDQAALNLVLKDASKDVWTGIADIGLGYGDDFLYDNRLMGMQFNKKRQTLLMYKNNNTGKNIAAEISRFGAGSGLLNNSNDVEDGVLAMLSVGSANIDKERYNFNHSHLLAGNWLLKLNKNTDLRVQGNGLIDKTDMQSYRSTTYLNLPDLPIVVEEQTATGRRNQWKGEINLQSNGTKTYVSNNIQGSINLNKSTGKMVLGDKQTDLSVKPQRQQLSDNFRLSHTTQRGNVYEIKGLVSYLYMPGELLTINETTEKLDFKFLNTQGALKYRLRLGHHYLNNEMGITYDYQDMGATLPPAEKESHAYQQSQVYYTPSMSFVFGELRLDGAAKVKYMHQSYRGSMGNEVFLEPRFSFAWEPTAKSKLTGSALLRHSPLEGKQIYDLPIFTSYRNVKENRGEVDTQQEVNFSLGYQYTNPLKGFFFNIRPYYSLRTNNILYESSLQENIYRMTATDKDYTNRSYGTQAGVSKSFGWANLYLGLSGSYRINNYKLLIADQLDKARLTTTSLKFEYSLHPIQMLTIEGNSSVRNNKQQNLSEPERYADRSITSWEHNLDLHLFPDKHWMLTLNNELYHSKGNNLGMNYYCDFSISYKAKRWELQFLTNNIFDTSQFKRQTVSSTVSTYSITTLRPREYMVKYSFDL